MRILGFQKIEKWEKYINQLRTMRATSCKCKEVYEGWSRPNIIIVFKLPSLIWGEINVRVGKPEEKGRLLDRDEVDRCSRGLDWRVSVLIISDTVFSASDRPKVVKKNIFKINKVKMSDFIITIIYSCDLEHRLIVVWC